MRVWHQLTRRWHASGMAASSVQQLLHISIPTVPAASICRCGQVLQGVWLAMQEAAFRRQVQSKLLKEAMEEWRTEAAFAVRSRTVIAAAVARMRGQALLAALDTWRAEASKQRKVSCEQRTRGLGGSCSDTLLSPLAAMLCDLACTRAEICSGCVHPCLVRTARMQSGILRTSIQLPMLHVAWLSYVTSSSKGPSTDRSCCRCGQQ